MTKFDYVIIGAGFAGAVCAERLAAKGKRILVLEKRSHIGGNAFDKLDSHGILVHPYGPHIFHTNSKKVFEYLSQFTNWTFYEHRVLAEIQGRLLPIPINRTTINKLYNLTLDESEVETYLATVRHNVNPVKTSEDIVLNSVGTDLCNKFFRGYTKKQWGLELNQLSAGVAARIPTRTNDDDRYFADTYQFMPADGYTAMFERLLSSKLITVKTDSSTTIEEAKSLGTEMIYSGPIDAYFEYQYGKLPYRSLRFEHSHQSGSKRIQPCGTVNYPMTEEYTRITEFRHLTGDRGQGTSLVKEYPTSEGDPYYPIPRPENEELFKKYQQLAEREENTHFVGRLAEYRYYNMDQVVAAALATCTKIESGN